VGVKMAKRKKRSAGATTRKWAQLRKLLKVPELTADRLGDLVEVVGWLLDHGHQRGLLEMLDHLPDDQADRLQFALEEAGYRLPVTIRCTDGSEAEGLAIPFAWLLLLGVPGGEIHKLSGDLQLAEAALERCLKLLRRELALGEAPTLVLSGKLYRVDEPFWDSPQEVRSWLKRMLAYLEGLCPPPFFRTEGTKSEAPEGEMVLAVRALTGLAIASQLRELESALFRDQWEDAPRAVISQCAVEELGEIIARGLEELGYHGWEVTPMAMPLELFEVPEAGLALYRASVIRLKVEQALCKEGRLPDPVVYVSFHGKGVVKEVRIAAYPSPISTRPFFTYVWEVVSQLETPDAVMDTIVGQVVKPLGASLFLVSGLLPDKSEAFPGPLSGDLGRSEGLASLRGSGGNDFR